MDSEKDTEEDIKYAGFNIRMLAFIIDSVVLVILILPFYLIIINVLDISALPTGQIDPTTITNEQLIEIYKQRLPSLAIEMILFCIAIVAFWVYRSSTPGKMIFRMRIVDSRDFSQPSNKQLIGRFFAYYVSMFPLFFGFIWIAFDKRKQGWHDKLSKTVVVIDKKKKQGNDV